MNESELCAPAKQRSSASRAAEASGEGTELRASSTAMENPARVSTPKPSWRCCLAFKLVGIVPALCSAPQAQPCPRGASPSGWLLASTTLLTALRDLEGKFVLCHGGCGVFLDLGRAGLAKGLLCPGASRSVSEPAAWSLLRRVL